VPIIYEIKDLPKKSSNKVQKAKKQIKIFIPKFLNLIGKTDKKVNVRNNY